MQTFVPISTLAGSAQVLDNKRLGKQRVENLQILQTLLGLRVVNIREQIGKKKIDLPSTEWQLERFDPKGWRNHPAVKMWRGHEEALLNYQLAMCGRWVYGLGFKDTCAAKSRFLLSEAGDVSDAYPAWWGDPAVHSSHRSALLFKEPSWYGQFGWTEAPVYEYVWPVV